MLSIPLDIKNTWENRFWDKVKKTDYCWQWVGTRTRSKPTSNRPTTRQIINDYGVFAIKSDKKRTYKAHRVSYSLIRGKIAENLVLDHLCKNTLCVNPSHLEAVTQQENTLRGDGYSKMKRCINGHEYNEKDWYVYYSTKYPNGRRGCNICLKKQKNKHYLANKHTFNERKDKINTRRREVAKLKREGKWL